MNSIFTRRSVRSFLDKEVEKEKIDKIIRAAMQAPSAMNKRPWEFLVIRGKENIKKLANVSRFSKPIENANVVIVTLFNRRATFVRSYWQQDLGAATQNILLEGTELGLGTLWVGVAPDEEKMKYISELFNLDKNLNPYSIIGIGYPEKEDANKFIDRYEENKVRYID